MENAGLFVSEVASHFQHCYQEGDTAAKPTT